MLIHAKIGTMALQLVRVRYKRKLPKVGDVFEVYEVLDGITNRPYPGCKPSPVRCTEIKTIGPDQQVWYLDRW